MRNNFDINKESGMRCDCVGNDHHISLLQKEEIGWVYTDCCGTRHFIGKTDEEATENFLSGDNWKIIA